MSSTKNLGQVSGLFIGLSAPENTTLIWYDSTPNQQCHKVYDAAKKAWVALNPQIVAQTTYSELVNNAKKNGLAIGKFYQITDKSNTLAIAIASTKVQYADSIGNLLVDDLGTNIQYHVSSDNLLIDDLGGVWNSTTNKLIFQFSELTPNNSTDYLFGKARSGNKWVLAKFALSKLLSAVSGNSLTWDGGLFFNFKYALASIIDKEGGVVSKEVYDNNLTAMQNAISAVAKENQTIIKNANTAIEEGTSDDAIFGKKNTKDIDTATAAGDILKGDTLFTIVSKIQRWINKFKYATGIQLSRSYADATKEQYINNNDTVESAFGKVQYFIKNSTKTSLLPEDWSTAAKSGSGSTAYAEDGYPVAGDSVFYSFSKIVDFLKNSLDNIILTKTGSISESKPSDGYSLAVNDSLITALKKLELNTKYILEGQLNDYCVSYSKIKNTGVLPTDVMRIEFINSTGDRECFSDGCGIGGIISNEGGFSEQAYVFRYDSNYPTDPYRLVDNQTYWGDESRWPQVLAFIPVTYFDHTSEYSQSRWTNAASFVHIAKKVYLQFIIYFSDAALAHMKTKGSTAVFNIQIDAYSNKSTTKTVSYTLNKIITLNVNVSEAIMSEYSQNNRHVIFTATLTNIS